MKNIRFSVMLVIVCMIASAFMDAPAVVTDSHDQFPTTNAITNTCNGESISLTGVMTIDVHSVINDNKANITTRFHSDVTGVGDLGNTYRGVFNQNETQEVILQNGTYTEYLNAHETLVSNGSAPNLKSSVQFKITVAPNGDITVVKDNESFECE